MAIQIGDKAPAFTAYETPQKSISLSDFEGKKNVLLLFFPLAFTSTCTEELCSIRDNPGKYNNENTQVLGISVDSVFALARYKEDQGYNFPLLSDFNKAISPKYDSLYSSFLPIDMQGVTKRSAFIADKKGIIRYAEILDDARELPDFEKIDKILAVLQ